MPPEAVRFVWIDDAGVHEFGVNDCGVPVPLAPDGWCDADVLESEALLNASLRRRGARQGFGPTSPSTNSDESNTAQR